MIINFVKMHAQGNDYIYFDFLDKALPQIDFSKLAIKLSDRHFGVGGDGIVLILPDNQADARMRMFNADGSEGAMCGSALRCVTGYLHKKYNRSEFTINTNSGLKTGIAEQQKDFLSVKVNMGEPEFLQETAQTVNNMQGYHISVGNPHFVTFVDNIYPAIATEIGSAIENSFPGGVNVEFIKINSPHSIIMKVWERGSGATLACGTGTCASVFAGIKCGYLTSPVEVEVPGGKVFIDYDGKDIFLSGEVSFVFDGRINI